MLQLVGCILRSPNLVSSRNTQGVGFCLFMETNKIRNFVVISHVDHGKSTLADRFLELTGTVSQRQLQPQYLDQLESERERGITIKMAPVRLTYNNHILNLIDTPGHSDFAYESLVP